MRRLVSLLVGSSLVLTVAGVAAAGGPPAPAFYVDGAIYRTVGTPTDFSRTGAPASSFDVIYALGGGLRNVAEAKPGDTDYNGGRWMVLPVTWHVTPYQLTSAEAVLAAEDAGHLTVASTPVRMFECPVIPMRGAAN